MPLFARLTANDSTKISAHAFGALMRLWASGLVTRAQVIDRLGLTGDTQTIADIDAIAATYSALPTNNTNNTIIKAQWPSRLEGVAVLSEQGLLTESEAKSLIGF